MLHIVLILLNIFFLFRIQQDDVRGYLNLGRVLTQLRRYEEAEMIYLQVCYFTILLFHLKQFGILRKLFEI